MRRLGSLHAVRRVGQTLATCCWQTGIWGPTVQKS